MQIMFFCTFEIALFSNFRALCSVIINLDAIFVTTGDPNEESIMTEIIDLGHPENVCSGLPNYPIALGAFINDVTSILRFLTPPSPLVTLGHFLMTPSP